MATRWSLPASSSSPKKGRNRNSSRKRMRLLPLRSSKPWEQAMAADSSAWVSTEMPATATRATGSCGNSHGPRAGEAAIHSPPPTTPAARAMAASVDRYLGSERPGPDRK
jgi:hypothetical protein